jgi:large subunit ribosomal protein L29
MNVSEMRAKSVAELKTELVELQKEQFNLRLQVASGQNKNTARVNSVRKDVARIKTLINEKNQVDQVVSDSTDTGK